VALAKAELNNTVHLCSIDVILKPVHHVLFFACLLAKVVVAKAELYSTVRCTRTVQLASCYSTSYIGLGCKISNLYARKRCLTMGYNCARN
jgi:hypothetical protein